MYYRLYGIQLESDCEIPSFKDFLSEKDSSLTTVVLNTVRESFVGKESLFSYEHTGLNVSVLDDGWLFSLPEGDCKLFAEKDYLKLTAYVGSGSICFLSFLPLLRTALECAAAMQGLVSLHASCLKLDGKAVCLTASSGTGKSTRAQSWVNANGAIMLSGDRPIIKTDSSGIFACGAPWDGKEQIFLNDSAPLTAICDIRRGNMNRVRKLSVSQARRVLMQQCFIPMWDTVAATFVMTTIAKLIREIPVYRTVCGPDEESARAIKEIIFSQKNISGVEKDMKIKDGFVLKSVAGENIVMPAGDNIKKFDGAVVLNEVAAFIWTKLEKGASRNELIEHVLSEFDVDADKAADDLDALLEKLSGYGVIEEETV